MRTIAVSEYGLVPVDQPVLINRALREQDCWSCAMVPYGEMLMPMDSRAFAVVDHQLAHIYVRDSSDLSNVQRLVESIPGVDAVVAPANWNSITAQR